MAEVAFYVQLMTSGTSQDSRRSSTLADVALAMAVFGGLAFTVYMLQRSQGASSWPLDLACGVVVGLAAIARRVHPVVMAVTGWLVALVAVGSAWAADLPQEPGPATALALAALLAAVITNESAGTALAVVGLAFVVQAVAWYAAGRSHDGLTAVTVYNLLLTAGAIAYAYVLRMRRTSARLSGRAAA